MNILELEPLEHRREYLCLRFAQKCTKNDQTKKMFPLNEKLHNMNIRRKEKFTVQYAKTERLKKSAIIYMQKIVNEQS